MNEHAMRNELVSVLGYLRAQERAGMDAPGTIERITAIEALLNPLLNEAGREIAAPYLPLARTVADGLAWEGEPVS